MSASIAAADSATSSPTAERETPLPASRRRDESTADLRHTARITGALYLVLFVLGPFVYFYVPGELFADDAATTASQIASNTGLFTAGMIAESMIVGIEIVIVGLLWKLFRPVSESLALSASLARVGMAFVQTVSVLLAGGVLIIVDRGGLSGLDDDDRASVVGLLVDTIGLGVFLWGLLFGFHLLMLGVLVLRSDLLPRWIGVLLLVASVGYLAQSYGHLVDTDLDTFFETFVLVSIPGELAFAGYLLLRGVRPGDRPTG
ncbi:MAG: DUF4386 domain-containing protein [Ilumatobacter sp.]